MVIKNKKLKLSFSSKVYLPFDKSLIWLKLPPNITPIALDIPITVKRVPKEASDIFFEIIGYTTICDDTVKIRFATMFNKKSKYIFFFSMSTHSLSIQIVIDIF